MFGKGDRSHMLQWNVFLITLPNDPFCVPYFLTKICWSDLAALWWNFSMGLFITSLHKWWRNCFLDSSFKDSTLFIFQLVILWLHFSPLCIPMFQYAWLSMWWIMNDWLVIKKIVGYLVNVPVVCFLLLWCGFFISIVGRVLVFPPHVIQQNYPFVPFLLFCCYCIFLRNLC